jgi:hypothetical protein
MCKQDSKLKKRAGGDHRAHNHHKHNMRDDGYIALKKKPKVLSLILQAVIVAPETAIHPTLL